MKHLNAVRTEVVLEATGGLLGHNIRYGLIDLSRLEVIIRGMIPSADADEVQRICELLSPVSATLISQGCIAEIKKLEVI